MKITFILKDLSEVFFNGNGTDIVGFNHKTDEEKLRYLLYQCRDLGVTSKIGHNSFRDRVDFNHLMKQPIEIKEYKLEPRRGYRLATFEVDKL